MFIANSVCRWICSVSGITKYCVDRLSRTKGVPFACLSFIHVAVIDELHHNVFYISLTFDLRLFGKRLALTETELSTKSPAENHEEGMLMFADQPCSCPELSSEGCSTCHSFAVKMGMFVNICECIVVLVYDN